MKDSLSASNVAPNDEPVVPPILEVTGLSTRINLERGVVRAVNGVNLHLNPGETLGIVGESGCGKSMTGLSILGLLPPQGHITAGSIKFSGTELVGLPDRRYQHIRGNDIAMVFQDSMTALNPTKTIGAQVAEPVRRHTGASKKAALDRALEVLHMVGLPAPHQRVAEYPHQLSGGLRQRVMIAMALACEPRVLIADEPTTALDVTIQAQILQLLDDLKDLLSMSVILITHDMGVVAGRANRVNVMYAGEVVESGPTEALFASMRHPYTQGLLASVPHFDHRRDLPLHSIPGIPPDLTKPIHGCPFAPRCAHATQVCVEQTPAQTSTEQNHMYACWHPISGPVSGGQGGQSVVSVAASSADGASHDRTQDQHLLQVHGLVKEFPLTKGALLRRANGSVKAVSGVSFDIAPGETFGLVGESGCGKTTIARTVVALEAPTSGDITFRGSPLDRMRGSHGRHYRRDLQMIFQDPYDSLDPRMRVGALIREPLAIHHDGNIAAQMRRVRHLLDEVGLPANAMDRHPHELSGGQRQRIGLARALALNPALIVADEPVSALDVSIRSQVLNLMKDLQRAHGLTYLMISHDLTVVKYMSDRIGVMYLGKLVETADSEDLYANPAHPYTAGLIAAIPQPRPETDTSPPAVEISGELPSPVDPPTGCRFHTRCPFARQRCIDEEPEMRSFGPGHFAACHYPLQPPSPQPAAPPQDASTVCSRRA